MAKMGGNAARGWTISAGAVGKAAKGEGLSIRSAPYRTVVSWQLHGTAGRALPAAQARQVWYGVLAALVGDD
ncbi:hypothetical protein [Pseudoduganella aquatica]|uniref:Uncharacterized protein n=1 Tax=Pseudoduganella aquatica TaxID=2660641 RepID=A0A7X4KQE1_9BURK|nr:hypothetical protein [Pseudoduganella aquatica]MYN11157.1 hypothetical protein [Pseudoduganella aquatica]